MLSSMISTWAVGARRVLTAAAGLLPLPALAQLREVTAPSGTAQGTLENSILRIVNVFLILVGITAAIFLIYGGIQYILSRGEDKELEKAKSTILYAVIGLLVVGLAAAIVNFVIRAIAAA